MVFLRVRQFGSADWTEVVFDGDLDTVCSDALANWLYAPGNLHIQIREVDGSWEDFEPEVDS